MVILGSTKVKIYLMLYNDYIGAIIVCYLNGKNFLSCHMEQKLLLMLYEFLYALYKLDDKFEVFLK